jgi:3-oxoacyl-[acyl-carrier-protein] synthase-1
MREPVRIQALGARAPHGVDALTVAMCGRAQLFEPRSGNLRDRQGRAIGAHVCRCLPDDLFGSERLVRLAVPALHEAIAQYGEAASLPLVLSAGDADRPDGDQYGDLLERIATAAGMGCREGSLFFRGGNVGFALALHAALELLDTVAAVVVGAVDSYYHPDVFAWLDQDRRLNGHGIEGGIVPSEGAAFFVIARGGAGPQIRHLALGTNSAEDLAARGMTDLVRGGCSSCGRPLAWMMSDVNGELHRQREWSIVEHRLGELLAPDVAHRQLPGDTGDVGAATGALMLATACQAWATHCAPSDTVLGLLHGDGSDRAVLVVQCDDQRERDVDPIRAPSVDAHKAVGILARIRDGLSVEAARQLGGALDEAVHACARWSYHGDRDAAALTLLDDARAALETCWQQATIGQRSSLRAAARNLGGLVAFTREARERLVDALATAPSTHPSLARRARTDRRGAADFVSSVGEPALHSFERPMLLPGGGTDEAEGDQDLAPLDLAAELERFERGQRTERPQSAPRPDAGIVRAESPVLDQLRRLARSTMGDVAGLGSLRTPIEERPWSGTIDTEQRLLESLDAWMALARASSTAGSDLLDDLWRFAHWDGVADSGRAFLRSFVLGCTSGRDTVDAAVVAARRDDRRTLGAHRAALALAPNRAIADAMRALLDAGDTRMAELGLEVLRARREVDFARAVIWLDHPNPRTAARAAAALAVVPEREAARQALERAIVRVNDPHAGAAIAEALHVLGSTTGLDWLRERLRQEAELEGLLAPTMAERMATLVALAGRGSDAAMLAGVVRRGLNLEILGWHGHPSHVPVLLNELDGECDVPGALNAIRRIAGLPVDRFRHPARELRSWWEEHGSRFDVRFRYRFGEPYRAIASLRELDDVRSRHIDRQRAALEIAPYVDCLVEVEDWAARQRQTLATMAARLET